METITVKIDGMSCAGCVGSVSKALKSVKGVLDAVPDLMSNTAIVTSDGTVEGADLVKALSAKGYKAKVVNPISVSTMLTPGEKLIDLSIKGMTCAGCVSSIEKAMAQVPGVLSSSCCVIHCNPA